MNNKLISQDDIMNLLDGCYEKCLNGIPYVSPRVEELADNYCKKSKNKEEACKSMINSQIIKCTTSGFITGFGGAITMPVTIPANVGSVLYVQMRMIACTAYLAGFDLDCDQTQTFVYACLAGVTVNELVKQTGIKIGMSFSKKLVEKIPGKALTKINQKVGFRLLTKFGSKGLINIGKALPVVGAIIGGGFDLAETKAIGDRAYKWFFKHDFSGEEMTETDIVEEVDQETT